MITKLNSFGHVVAVLWRSIMEFVNVLNDCRGDFCVTWRIGIKRV